MGGIFDCKITKYLALKQENHGVFGWKNGFLLTSRNGDENFQPLYDKPLKIGMRIVFYAILSLMLVAGCDKDSKRDKKEKTVAVTAQTPSAATLVMQVSQCSRLYTTEFKIHKIVTHADAPKLKGKVLGIPVDVPTRLGDRKVAIPIEVTMKAYIDFGSFSEKQLERTDTTLVVILPDPVIVATASKVDNQGIRQYIDLTRSRFTDEEIMGFARQGADSIKSHAAGFGIVEQAQQSAANLLIPMFARMGYKPENITIRFRKDFTDADIVRMIKD